MPRRRREIPTFFSIEVGPVRGIAESMDDAQWGKWSKKALDDLSIGCIRKDTDPRVKELFEKSKSGMDAEYQRKHDWYEAQKNAMGPAEETEALESQARESRRAGADSLRSDCHSAPVRSLPMPSKEQLYDFARAESLDEADARDWYEMTVVDRSGNDREGKPITNWKAALKRFCKSRADRRTA